MDAMLGKGTVSETLLKHEIKKNKQLEKESAAKDRDILIGKLDAHILRAVQIGKKPKDEAIKSFADANKMTVKEVEKLGKEASIL